MNPEGHANRLEPLASGVIAYTAGPANPLISLEPVVGMRSAIPIGMNAHQKIRRAIRIATNAAIHAAGAR